MMKIPEFCRVLATLSVARMDGLLPAALRLAADEIHEGVKVKTWDGMTLRNKTKKRRR